MAVPDFQALMLPILAAHLQAGECTARDLVAELSDVFGLSAEDRAATIPSGRQTLMVNRAAWAVTHLCQAALLERVSRGRTRLTPRGEEVLAGQPERVDMRVLKGFPEYNEFRARKRVTAEPSVAVDAGIPESPREAIPALAAEANATLAAELITRLQKEPPAFMERCVVDLLRSMGYGGREGEVRHVGGSNDGGIDGLIRQDALGLDVVYIQAKRYGNGNVVQRPELHAFVGAMHGRQANRGIFITTSSFSDGAVAYAREVASHVVLIDGTRLGTLMVQYRCGVKVVETVELIEIDEDFFE